MSSLYLWEGLEAGDGLVGSEVELTGPEAHHAMTVSRVRVGERIAVGNGRGLIVRGRVSSVRDRVVTVLAESVEETPRPSPSVTLVQALAKGDRDELAIQAATELGVDRVVPWAAERSVSRWAGPKAGRGRERWGTIVREAAKQSIRPWVPGVGALATTGEISGWCGRALVLVLDPDAEEPLTGLALEPTPAELVLVVGPEGGISPSELAALTGAGARAVRLGSEVLRTSTAGPAALAALSVLIGRW